MSCLNYFTTHEWRFISENPIQLLEKMSPEDRRVFYFDVRTIDWPSYIETYALGTRRFILKDDPSTLPAARRHMTRLVQQHHQIIYLSIDSSSFMLLEIGCFGFNKYHALPYCYSSGGPSFHVQKRLLAFGTWPLPCSFR